MLNNSPRGSDWRKWDLHIHSPASFFWRGGKSLNDMNPTEKDFALKEFIRTLNDSDVAAFCIMDYWTFDWCVLLKKYMNTHPNELKKPVFTGMELRIECPVNYRLNIHVILSDILTEQQLTDFKAELKIRIGTTSKNLSDQALISFARSLSKDKTKSHGYEDPDQLDDKKLLELGSKTAEVTKDSLLNAFKQIPKDSGYIILPYDTSDGVLELDWSKHPQDDNFFMQTAAIFESRNRKNIDLFNGIKTKENEKFFDNFYKTLGGCSKPCVSGSDAHSFADYGKYPSAKITWIKAEPSFEGLKQILYEPSTRVFIGGNKPKFPINIIDSITFNIPNTAKLGEDKFCFANKHASYELSPYFNCFIGGRGSGKSTILNFLGLKAKNPTSSNEFWFGNNKDKCGLNPSNFDPNDKNIFDLSGTEIFEFLAQSEIETFARDKTKFTQAIYERAEAHAGNVLEGYENTIDALKEKLDKIIQATVDLQNLEKQKSEKEKEQRTLENSIKVLSSKEYQDTITKLRKKSKELQIITTWKDIVSDLKESLYALLPEPTTNESLEDKQKTAYEKAYDLANIKITEAVELLKNEQFIEEKNKEIAITKDLNNLEDKAKLLIEKAGYTSESVAQIKSAPQKIMTLTGDIKTLTMQIESNIKIIATRDTTVSSLNTNKTAYEDKIKEVLQPLQDSLKKQFEDNNGKDIKQISLEYCFDDKNAWIVLANEFYEKFKAKYSDSERSKEVCDYIIDNKQIFSKDFLHDIKEYIQQSKKGSKKYHKFIDEIFKDERNFIIFQTIRDKHLYDVKNNKIIQVKYNNRDIEQASFGQRCTAVVVILLLFGNYPLIIDEPEAHLDSSLIANYLVPLLKQKKVDRQIIFATHNANFVINGDAEKIFSLQNKFGETSVVETTIENISNREELLNLEGGKEAFEKRGEKLQITLT